MLFLSSSAEAEEYDYSIENTIEGIRNYLTFFTSPDGSRICILSGTSASIYDVSTGNLVVERQFEDLRIRDGCWIGDEIVIATGGSQDGLTHPDPILILSPNDLASIEEHSPTTQYLRKIEASPTGQYIAASNENGLFVFDTVNYELIYESDVHPYSIRAIAWDDGEGRIAAVGRSIYIHDISEKTTQKISTERVSTELLFWAQGDTRIYSLEVTGVMEYYNVSSGEREFEDGIASSINAGDVNPSNNDVCFGHGGDWIILSLDTLEKKKEVQDAVGLIRKIVWDWETYRLLTTSKDGVLRIYRDSNDPSYNSPPVVTIIKPGGGETITTDLIAEGTMTDDNQVLVGFYRLNDLDWHILDSTSHWTLTIESTDMVEGTNTLYLKASDGDHETIEQVTFNYDGSSAQDDPPTIMILSPVQGSTVRGVLNVSGVATDDKGVVAVEISIEGGGWLQATGTLVWHHLEILDEYSSDAINIRARSYDGGQYSPIASVDLVLDHTQEPQNERPAIILESPLEGDSVVMFIDCRGRTEDDGPAVDTYLSIDGTDWRMIGSTTEWAHQLSMQTLAMGKNILN